MALIGNYTVLAKTPGRAFAGSTISDNRSQTNKSGANLNRFVGADQTWDPKAAQPNGYLHPYAWVLPLNAGGMSSYTVIGGTGSVDAANLAGGLNGESAIAGTSSLTAAITGRAQIVASLAGVAALAVTLEATGALSATIGGTGAATGDLIAVLNATATLTGSGSISSATLQSVINAVAELSGSGGLAGTLSGAVAAAAALSGSGSVAATLNATVAAAAELAGSGGLTATLRALAVCVAELTGSGSAAGTMRADGYMQANISVAAGGGEELTAAGLAAAVWNAVAEDVNLAGTTGEALNLALAILRNKTITDPDTGTFTVYDADGTTVLLQASLYEDAAGTAPYSGAGAERRERLT